MTDIELVIKIDEEDYKTMKHNIAVGNPLCPLGQREMVTAVANGTPLPVKHGRLVDERDLSLMTVHMIDGKLICDAPTIVEANYAELEEKHLGNPEDKTGIYADDYDEPETVNMTDIDDIER